MTSCECKLPDIAPYFEGTGRGTAYIGSMIKEEMTKYATDAMANESQRAAEIIMSYAYGDDARVHLLQTIANAILASNPAVVAQWADKKEKL